ncbi:phosphatidic acid phosphatase protein, putative [Trypanosoma brucei gambiense DAL972]|uniref:Phosphatidic acid phosphatase protein, putative n=1 Tax=Trypanosoma brucei gambiense (strain MHOM/CI/86/DAL972) TaxID=679716 RepID=C9ZUG5_TRYB9|nr:phosphatidic acid phosphatase protein, putative [Trypanosoma brucei gambiense DAL972]CBH13053.1 phosphatidic acid phosphatase protein, putative [Trypanosoma brucei gambiense DAL972]|eukprot:XP_011775330.1 phosphatidic acid phosphatase protein, putative [Trypanosoma brucei gambiense DAL972]
MADDGKTGFAKFVYYIKVFHALDYILLVTFALAVVYGMRTVRPPCRTFSWNDTDISHKKGKSTFPSGTLFSMEFIPIGLYLLFEALRARLARKGEWYLDVKETDQLIDGATTRVEMLEPEGKRSEGAHSAKAGRYPDESPEMNRENEPKRLMTCLEATNYWVLAHGFSIILAVCLVEILKVYAGRLRPDFLDRLKKANVTEGTDPKDLCDIAKARDGRLSFPSGHSSCAFSVCTPMALYFLSVLHAFSGASVWRTLVGLSPIYLACACAISRTRDNRHHFADIVAGSLIGMGTGLLAVAVFFRFGKEIAVLVPRRMEFVRSRGGRVLADVAE